MRVTAVTQMSGERKLNWILLILLCPSKKIQTYLFEQLIMRQLIIKIDVLNYTSQCEDLRQIR